MKILLARSPTGILDIRMFSYRHPVNLAGLAAYVRATGHTCVLKDYHHAADFTDDGFVEFVRREGFDAVGLSSYTNNIDHAHRLATLVKARLPHVTTLIGGPHSSAIPSETLAAFPAFDVVVVGEGEVTLVEVLDRLEQRESLKGLAGIAHRVDGEIVREAPREPIRDLDALPFPARDLLDLESRGRTHYSPGILQDEARSTDIYTARGCPSLCIFCAVNLSHASRKLIRMRSAENVLAEVEECVSRHGIGHFRIADDTFTVRKKRALEIARGMARLGVSWECDTKVNAVTREMVREMVACGCRKISFGIESGSPRILEQIKKGITVEEVREAFRWSHEAGLANIEGNVMVGNHPDETEEDVDATIKLLKEIKPDYMSISIAVPYPGTELYEIMDREGLILSKDWSRYVMFDDQLPVWRTRYFGPADLVRLHGKVIRGFYFTPRFIARNFRDPRHALYLTRAGLEYFWTRLVQRIKG